MTKSYTDEFIAEQREIFDWLESRVYWEAREAPVSLEAGDVSLCIVHKGYWMDDGSGYIPPEPLRYSHYGMWNFFSFRDGDGDGCKNCETGVSCTKGVPNTYLPDEDIYCTIPITV